MKYRITGINPKLTIQKYKLLKDKNAIKVTYLRGGSDYHANSPEVIKTVEDKMIEQAKVFMDDNIGSIKRIILAVLIILLSLGGFIFFPTSYLSLIPLCIGVFNVFNALISSRNQLKYKLYFENQEVIENEYEKVSKKEREIRKEKTKEIEQPKSSHIINNLDEISLSELKDMLLKVKRYQEINQQELENEPQKILKRK